MKIKKLFTLLALTIGVGAMSMPSFVEVKAESEEEIVEVIEEPKESLLDKFYDETKEFKETYVQPIIIALGSINLATIFSLVATLISNHVKEKARNGKFDTLNAKVEEFNKKANEILDKMVTAKANIDIEVNQAIEMIKEQVEVVKSMKADESVIAGLKNSVVSMSEALVLLLKQNKETFKQGLTEQVAELEKTISELSK